LAERCPSTAGIPQPALPTDPLSALPGRLPRQLEAARGCASPAPLCRTHQVTLLTWWVCITTLVYKLEKPKRTPGQYRPALAGRQ